MTDDNDDDLGSTRQALPLPEGSSTDAPTVNLDPTAADTLQANCHGEPVEVSEASTLNMGMSGSSTVRTQHAEAIVPGSSEGAGSGRGGTGTRLKDEGEIARGGMGAIHLVFDQAILRHAAMKVLHEGTKLPAGSQERFIEEARITGQLEHPNIVPIYDLQVDSDGQPQHFTMKLVHGRTLSEVIKEKSTNQISGQSLAELLRIFLKVCEALSFAHSRSVVHRDLKPDNIMVGSHGQVYVMDWGIALITDQPLATSPTTNTPVGSGRIRTQSEVSTTNGPTGAAGTPTFMAPEQTTDRLDDIDYRTDIYGLGGILYAILTAKAPRGGIKNLTALLEQASVGEIVPVEKAAPERRLPPGLCRIVTKALSANPEDRQQSVTELSTSVENFLQGGGWFEAHRFPAGTLIIKEGDVGDTAYIIMAGACDAYKMINGKRKTMRRMGPGEVFGETAVLTSRPRSATICAVDDVTALVVTRQSLEDELADKAWLGSFVKALATRFSDLDRQLSDLQTSCSKNQPPNDSA